MSYTKRHFVYGTSSHKGDSKKIGIAEATFISMLTMSLGFKTFISVKASVLEAGRLWIP